MPLFQRDHPCPLTFIRFCILALGFQIAAQAQQPTFIYAPEKVPSSLAINSVTNTVYLANAKSNTFTIYSPSSHQSSYAPTGMNPVALAVNPVTNKIYIVNHDSSTVSAIDGATYNSVTVPTGNGPVALAINTVTNKIYVAN